MKVILFGATGMIGSGALLECLDDARVEAVLVVGRASCGLAHRKVTEVLHQDVSDFRALQPRFTGHDACFYCLGVRSVGMKESAYRHLANDLTIAAANAISAASPRLTFCFLSAEGADSAARPRSAPIERAPGSWRALSRRGEGR